MYSPSPGAKSTEFWALVLLAVLVVANGTEYVNIPTDQFMWFGGGVMSYIGARAWNKNSMANASVGMAEAIQNGKPQPAGGEPMQQQGQ